MADRKSGNLLAPGQEGVFRSAIQRVRLIGRLIGDKRVSPWLKLIPIGALVYWISPVDLIMGIPGIDALDDAAVLWLGSTLFVELCPKSVVNEHLAQLNGDSDGEVVDAEATDVDQK